MRDALKFEVVRIRTIRSTYWLLLTGLLLCGLVALAFGLDVGAEEEMQPEHAAMLLTASGLPISVMGFFAALIGVFASGHEYRHGTILPTLTAIPRRTALLAAKVLVVAGVSVAAALAGIAVCWIVGAVAYGEAIPLAEPVPAILVGALLLVTLYGVLGVALGQLTRGIPAGIVIVLISPLLIEPVIIALSSVPALNWLQNIVPYLPFTAGVQLVSTASTSVGYDAETVVPLGRWAGGAVFAAYTALILAAAWRLFERRDA